MAKKLGKIVVPRITDEAGAERLAKQLQVLSAEFGKLCLTPSPHGEVLCLDVRLPSANRRFEPGELLIAEFVVRKPTHDDPLMSLAFCDDDTVNCQANIKSVEERWTEVTNWRKAVRILVQYMDDESSRLGKEAAKRRRALKAFLPQKPKTAKQVKKK